MKSILLIIVAFYLGCQSIYSQQVADREQASCILEPMQGIESIYGVCDSGKVLMVCHMAIDCGSCLSSVPALKTFCDANVDKIRCWAACDNRFSTPAPLCENVEFTYTNYLMSNFFMFTDEADYWKGSGYICYTVINPTTKKIVYDKGLSFSTAKAKALEAAMTTSVIANETKQSALQIYPNPFTDKLFAEITVSEAQEGVLKIQNILGQTIHNQGISLENGENSIPISLNEISNGVYFLSIQTKEGVFNGKIMR